MNAAKGKTTEATAPSEQTQDPAKPESLGEGHISGNTTQDVELRFTPTGRAVAKVRVAYAQRVKNPATGQWQDGEPQFYDIDVWGKQGENCAEYMNRGDRIVAVGEWFKRHWTDREGKERTSISLTARDIGPSMLFRGAAVIRAQRTGPPMGGPPPADDVPLPDEPQGEPPF